MQGTSSVSAGELADLLNPDKASASKRLAQSGVVSDATLDALLDRRHLVAARGPAAGARTGAAGAAAGGPAHGGSGKAAKGKKGVTSKAKGRKAEEDGEAEGAESKRDGEGWSLAAALPYPPEGVGYEVVLDKGRQAVGGLDRIDAAGEEGEEKE